MISAKDKEWYSPTILYIARKLEEIADGNKIAVLDMGCGDGKQIEYLLSYGYDFYGYDFPARAEALEKRLLPYFGNSYNERIRLMKDEQIIPFDDNSFDVIYANQVFEHVKFLDRMIAECARVLKPDGVLLTNFPTATYPIEGHIKIPFAHWIPPGRGRIKYLSLFYALKLRPKPKGYSVRETAIQQDRYLREQTYYRFMNEIAALSEYYFESWENSTDMFIRAKLDMMVVNRNPIKQWLGNFIGLFEGRMLKFVVTHFKGATFVLSHPKKEKITKLSKKSIE